MDFVHLERFVPYKEQKMTLKKCYRPPKQALAPSSFVQYMNIYTMENTPSQGKFFQNHTNL